MWPECEDEEAALLGADSAVLSQGSDPLTPISPSHKHKHPLATAFPFPLLLLEKAKLSFSKCQTSRTRLKGDGESGIVVSPLLVSPARSHAGGQEFNGKCFPGGAVWTNVSVSTCGCRAGFKPSSPNQGMFV